MKRFGLILSSLLAAQIVFANLALADSSAHVGEWTGESKCGRDFSTRVTLIISQKETGQLKGILKFIAINDPAISGEVEMRGLNEQRNEKSYRFVTFKWLKRPKDYNEIKLDISFDFDLVSARARFPVGGCKVFNMSRVGAPPVIASAPRIKQKNIDRQVSAPTELPLHQEMVGRWWGVGIKKDEHVENIELIISRQSEGVYSSVLTRSGENIRQRLLSKTGTNSPAFEVERPSNLPYHQNEPGVRSIDSFYEETKGKNYLRVWLQPNLDRVHLTRDQNRAKLSGRFGTAKAGLDRCMVVNDWLKRGEAERQIARELKIQFSVALEDYDTEQSQSISLLGEPLFSEFFDVTFANLGEDKFSGLFKDIADCAYMATVPDHAEVIQRHLFLPKEIVRARLGMTPNSPWGWRPERVVPVLHSYDAWKQKLAEANSAKANALTDLKLLTTENTINMLEQKLKQSFKHVLALPPSELQNLLTPLYLSIVARNENIATENRLNLAKRRASLFDGVDLPQQEIPSEYSSSVRDLQSPNKISFDATTMTFAAGFASTSTKTCDVAIRPEAIPAMTAFLRAGRDRAVWGGNYSGASATERLGDQASSATAYAAGELMAKNLDCSLFAHSFTKAIAEAVLSTSTDEIGGDSRFVRTCAVELNRPRCKCLSNMGQAIIPEIHQLTYHRDIIAKIISGSPAYSLKVAVTCGISRY